MYFMKYSPTFFKAVLLPLQVTSFIVFCIILPMCFCNYKQICVFLSSFLIQKVTYYMCSFVFCKDFKAFDVLGILEDFGNLFQADGNIFWLMYFMKEVNNQMAGRARMQLGFRNSWNGAVNVFSTVFTSWSCLPLLYWLYFVSVFLLSH